MAKLVQAGFTPAPPGKVHLRHPNAVASTNQTNWHEVGVWTNPNHRVKLQRALGTILSRSGGRTLVVHSDQVPLAQQVEAMWQRS
eukprot:CAMPEP_0178403228 /NCGR_PEP_ID=MMETSP0689_2-20121128/17258_1 /TAXON_ID=160604 /ORGANISM="Amphidinium massartii, Strain CS-259" /LENGTH=84 /DNA_ID=CAMNT_0020024171 /DNA_START=660 /DNA_END=915 /DNA_ORIENTATION=-